MKKHRTLLLRFATNLSSREAGFCFALLGVLVQACHTWFLAYELSSLPGIWRSAQAGMMAIFISAALLYFTLKSSDEDTKQARKYRRIVWWFACVETFINLYYWGDHLLIEKWPTPDYGSFIIAIPFSILLPFVLKSYGSEVRTEDYSELDDDLVDDLNKDLYKITKNGKKRELDELSKIHDSWLNNKNSENPKLNSFINIQFDTLHKAQSFADYQNPLLFDNKPYKGQIIKVTNDSLENNGSYIITKVGNGVELGELIKLHDSVNKSEPEPEPIQEKEPEPEPIQEKEPEPEPIQEKEPEPEPIQEKEPEAEPIQEKEPEPEIESKHIGIPMSNVFDSKGEKISQEPISVIPKFK